MLSLLGAGVLEQSSSGQSSGAHLLFKPAAFSTTGAGTKPTSHSLELLRRPRVVVLLLLFGCL
jgi:hypothetical protein